MILINYGTSAQFEPNTGDKAYCRSLSSAKKELKRLLTDYTNEDKETKKSVIRQFDLWVFNKKTCMSVGSANISVGYLNIYIEEINLI